MSSLEEKESRSLFLAFKWLIIFGSAAAGPGKGLQQQCFCAADAPLSLFAQQFQHCFSVWKGLLFPFGTREENKSHCAPKVNSHQVASSLFSFLTQKMASNNARRRSGCLIAPICSHSVHYWDETTSLSKSTPEGRRKPSSLNDSH